MAEVPASTLRSDERPTRVDRLPRRLVRPEQEEQTTPTRIQKHPQSLECPSCGHSLVPLQAAPEDSQSGLKSNDCPLCGHNFNLRGSAENKFHLANPSHANGGIYINDRPVEPVRAEEDGNAISPATGEAVQMEKEAKGGVEFRWSAGEKAADAEETMRFMARRKNNASPEDLAPKKCDEPGCNKEFEQQHLLNKHKMLHSRPFKCPIETCEYREYGFPSRKDLDRHCVAKHHMHTARPMYGCILSTCGRKFRGQHNRARHMRSDHGWPNNPEFDEERITDSNCPRDEPDLMRPVTPEMQNTTSYTTSAYSSYQSAEPDPTSRHSELSPLPATVSRPGNGIGKDDSPQPLEPLAYSPRGSSSPQAASFAPPTGSPADRGKLPPIQRTSPRSDTNGGMPLPSIRDQLGPEALSPTSFQQSPPPTPPGSMLARLGSTTHASPPISPRDPQSPYDNSPPTPFHLDPPTGLPHLSSLDYNTSDLWVTPDDYGFHQEHILGIPQDIHGFPQEDIHRFPQENLLGFHQEDIYEFPQEDIHRFPQDFLGVHPQYFLGVHQDIYEFSQEDIYEVSQEDIYEFPKEDIYGCQKEGTITDSGYESHRRQPSHTEQAIQTLTDEDTMEQGREQQMLASYQQTVYSTSTLAELPHYQEYIHDLCVNILAKLQEHTQNQDWSRLESCLPDLIKAFSIRIGLDKSNPASPEIMYFLHRYRKNMVQRLGDMFRNREESLEPDHPEPDHDGMAVFDKMSLWNRKANEDPVAHQGSLFEGVPDLEDDDINDINANISIHREYVLNSYAYQWFVTSLRTRLSLDWGLGDATEANINTPIHQTIMSKLPSGTVSKRRAPKIHHVKYCTEIDNDILRTLENQGVLIKDFMALTSSAPKMLQASTVQDYVHRVWPSGGAKLLTLVQKAFHGEHGSIYSNKYDDTTSITAQIERSDYSRPANLLVTASGTGHSISQCGEQLAWLGASIQALNPKTAACTCSIQSQADNEWIIHYSLDNGLRESKIGIDQRTHKLHDAMIIHGYPTERRPSLCQGLEIKLHVLLELIDAPWPPVLENGRIFLEGSHHTLQLIRSASNVLLWHVSHNDLVPCSYCDCHLKEGGGKLPSLSWQPEVWASSCRHIITNFEQLEILGIDSGFSSFDGGGQSHAQASIRSPETGYDFASRPQREEGFTPLASSENSLDSDMLSISSAGLDCADLLDPEDPLAAVVAVISHRKFLEYKNHGSYIAHTSQECTGTGSSEAGENYSNSAPSTESQPRADRPLLPQKRKHPDEEDDDRDLDGFRKPPKILVRSPSKTRSRKMACPFWKLDRQTHASCFVYKLKRISDVKLHLNRCHSLPAKYYCERCWKGFADQDSKNEHIGRPAAQMCEYMPSAKPAGIDKDMAKELHKKSKHTHSEEDKWFSIWDIIFPRTSRPSSPYIDDRLSEDASQLEELVSNQWPSIIASVIAEAQITGVSVDVDRLRLQHVLSATFARLTDQFSAERERGMSALASTPRSPSAWATPPSTGADSGIDMASYQRERQSFSGSNYTTSSSGTATSSQLDRQTQNLMQRSINDGRREITRATQGHNTNMAYGQYDTTPAQGPPSQRDVTNEQSGMPPQTMYASDVMQDPVATQTTAFNVDNYNFGAGLTGPDLDFLLEADPYIPLESSCVDTTLCVIPEDPLNYK